MLEEIKNFVVPSMPQYALLVIQEGSYRGALKSRKYQNNHKFYFITFSEIVATLKSKFYVNMKKSKYWLIDGVCAVWHHAVPLPQNPPIYFLAPSIALRNGYLNVCFILKKFLWFGRPKADSSPRNFQKKKGILKTLRGKISPKALPENLGRGDPCSKSALGHLGYGDLSVHVGLVRSRKNSILPPWEGFWRILVEGYGVASNNILPITIHGFNYYLPGTPTFLLFLGRMNRLQDSSLKGNRGA